MQLAYQPQNCSISTVVRSPAQFQLANFNIQPLDFNQLWTTTDLIAAKKPPFLTNESHDEITYQPQTNKREAITIKIFFF